jgi:hypothetical protein
MTPPVSPSLVVSAPTSSPPMPSAADAGGHDGHGAIRTRQPQPPGARPRGRAPPVRHHLHQAGTQPSVAGPDPGPLLAGHDHPALRAVPVPRHHQDARRAAALTASRRRRT